MKEFQQRVVDEKKELDSKREKLSNFLVGETIKTLPIEEQVRLHMQAYFMFAYSEMLGQRIANF